MAAKVKAFTDQEAAFLCWVSSEWMNARMVRENAMPSRAHIPVSLLAARHNSWLVNMQRKDRLMEARFLGDDQMAESLKLNFFRLSDGKSGTVCYWPDRDVLGALLFMQTDGKLGKEGFDIIGAIRDRGSI